MKTILCDIGGVLLKVDFNLAVVRLNKETGLAEQEIKDRIFTSGIKEKHDSGIISPYEFYSQVIKNKEISFSSFQVIWGEIFTENRDVVDCIFSRAKPCRLYIASNTDPIHYDFFQRSYPWFSLFDGYGLSFMLRSMKPSPQFYIKLCREFDINYKEAIFVDDLYENVEAANNLGIKSYLFVDVEGFKRFLADTIDD